MQNNLFLESGGAVGKLGSPRCRTRWDTHLNSRSLLNWNSSLAAAAVRRVKKYRIGQVKTIWLPFTGSHSKAIIFGLMYRHPRNTFSEVQDKVLQTIIKLGQDKLDYLICGDFNIDLPKCEAKPKISDYINTILSKRCSNIMNKLTCITECSAYLIDHMYTNVINTIINKGILTFDISDHTPIFCTLVTNVTMQFEKKKICDMRNFDKDSFLDDVNLLSSKIINFL